MPFRVQGARRRVKTVGSRQKKIKLKLETDFSFRLIVLLQGLLYSLGNNAELFVVLFFHCLDFGVKKEYRSISWLIKLRLVTMV